MAIKLTDLTIYNVKGVKKKYSKLTQDEIIDMCALGLGRIRRFGGYFDDCLSVLDHSLVVGDIVARLKPKDKELIYAAYMHEAEEALGLGDIVHDLKKFLFQNNKKELDEFRALVYGQAAINPAHMENEILKVVDIAVGIVEAKLITKEPAEYQFSSEYATKARDMLKDKEFEEEIQQLILMYLYMSSRKKEILFKQTVLSHYWEMPL